MDLFKAFDEIESSHLSVISLRKDLFFFMCAQNVMSYHLINISIINSELVI